MANVEQLIAETNQVRATLPKRTEFRNPEFLQELANQLEQTRYLVNEPIVQAFIEDARTFTEDARLVNTKRVINEARQNVIFSLFDASYFPSLKLEYLTYKKLPVEEVLKQKYLSNTTPVLIENMSKGFEARVVVALFPENQIDHLQCGDDRIFYFIDKFIERHQRVTQKMLEAIVAPDALQLVRNANNIDIQKASTYWVWLHEFHHRQGDMPITEYLEYKSLKPLAGLEELRVDVSGMLVCLRDKSLPEQDAALAYEFILSERLLRYAVEGIPKPNYDAVSSQLLFNYLIDNGGISLRNGIIHLENTLPDVLTSFLGEIKAIERQIHEKEGKVVQQQLLAFTNEFTDFDEKINDYQHIPYFAEVKEKLQV